jgi:uncharacterized protein (TIGR02444 family)
VTADSKDFWDWSLDHYGREGVSSLLLRLQDEFGFNVNIALWCCWCGEQFETMQDIVLRKAIDEMSRWNDNVTSNLRAARRHIKADSHADDAERDVLRKQIMDAELAAEHIEQATLQKLAETALTKAKEVQDRSARARRNLASYAALMGAASKKGFTVSLLETLIGNIFPEYAAESDNQV